MLRIYALFILASIPAGSCQSKSNITDQSVLLVLDPTAENASLNLSYFSEFVKDNSIQYAVVNVTGNSTNSSTFFVPGIGNVTLTDVSDMITNTDQSIETMNSNNSLIFVDVCEYKKKTWNSTRDLMTTFKNNIRGFYLNVDAKPNNTGNATLAWYINENILIDRSYLIRLDKSDKLGKLDKLNLSRYKLVKSMCTNFSKFIDNSTGKAKRDNRTEPAIQPCLNSTTNCTDENITISTSNTTQNMTDQTTTVNPNFTDTTTVLNATVPIPKTSTGHSKASLALGVLIVLIAATIACFVFRRRIFRLFKRNVGTPTADRQETAVRYGTLKNRDEFRYETW